MFAGSVTKHTNSTRQIQHYKNVALNVKLNYHYEMKLFKKKTFKRTINLKY